MKPSYETLIEKLQELNCILMDQNQDKNYDESLGHITAETQDLIDQAKSTQIHGYAIIASGDLGYSDEYTYFTREKDYAENLIANVISDVPNLKIVPATLTFNSNKV